MLPAIFPTPAEKERMLLIQKYAYLYENKAFEVLGLHDLILKQFKDKKSILYVAHNVPAKISEFYGDFVQGDEADLAIESTSESEAEQRAVREAVDRNDLKNAIYDFAVNQSAIGYEVLLARLDEDGSIVIDSVPQDQYFPQKDGSVIFASFIQIPGTTDPKSLWLYSQHYRPEGGTWIIERELHTVTAEGRKGDKLNLAMYTALPERENLDIPVIPVVQIDNGRRTRGFGKSDYADILPQLAEVNERTTHVAIQLLKNLDAKLTGPKGMLDENGQPKQWEVMERDTEDQPKPEYVLNENPLIEETYKHVEKQLQIISWLTAVPMHELMATASVPERVESLRIRLFSAIRRTNTKQAKLKKGINDILRAGLMLKRIPEPAEIRVKFGDVLPKDALVDAQVEQIKVSAGLSSRRSALKRLENLDDEQVDEEMKLIEAENTLAGVSDTANPPQI